MPTHDQPLASARPEPPIPSPQAPSDPVLVCFDASYRSAIETKAFGEVRQLKAAGTRVVGVYCAFTPRELISAAGAIPVSLCAGSEQPMAAAERHLPRALCPIVKSSYGHALEGTCPYFFMADLLLADATCDGKKKMFELMARIKPLHLLNLPQTAEGAASLRYWTEELKDAVAFLEASTGQPVTEAGMRAQIELHNQYRAAKLAVFELNTGPVPLVTGLEIEAIIAPTMFECNLPERIREIQAAIAALRRRAEDPAFRAAMARRPRILLTGCPTTNRKVLEVIEASGAVVPAMENCGGLKTLGFPVDQDGAPLAALARRYLATACSCMSPNTRRLDLIGSIIERYHIDAVVELTWEACHTYNVEAFQVREFVEERCARPYLQIRTDYSPNDTAQIRTRVGALLEMLD